MSLERPADQDIAVFGASGDLSRRKLIPALYNLAASDLLPERGKIIGLARTDVGEDGFRRLARQAVRQFSRTKFDEEVWAKFNERLTFVRLDAKGYARLKECAQEEVRLIYLAIPPSALPEAIRRLQEFELVAGTRLVVEKPFGHDLESARKLAAMIHEAFDETQLFRIDHYLGKETVQNIMVFRFGNSLFERVWNRDAIDHIQISVTESIGVDGRGAFYDETGALRDIVQNHALQMLSLITIDPPATVSAEAIHNEKMKVFHSMRPIDPARTVRGQYTGASTGKREVRGYREEKGVGKSSSTETFFAAEVFIDSWRWAGVPFLPADGETAGEAGDGGGRRVPRSAAALLRGCGAGAAEAQPSCPAYPAGRGDQFDVRGEAAGPGDDGAARRYGLQLR